MPQSPGRSLTNVPNVTQTAIIFGIYNWYLYDIFLGSKCVNIRRLFMPCPQSYRAPNLAKTILNTRCFNP